MKKIVSIIYSFEDVEKAADYAIKLARDLNLELEFLHAVESENISWDPTIKNYSSPSSISEGEDNLLVKERERVLQKLIRVKKASLDYNYPVRYSVVTGSVFMLPEVLSEKKDVEMVIVPYTIKNKIDVIISELIDKINLPVFTFPAEKEYQKIDTIVYASDYQKKDIKILKKVYRLARKFEASVTVFYASKSNEIDEELKKNGLQDTINKKIDLKDIQAEQEEIGGTAKGIRKFTQKSYADLVVLLKQNKSFLKQFFGRSKTKEILRDIDVPVLIYHQ